MGDLPKRWFTAGTNIEVWGSGGTYKAVPYEALPPLPARGDDDFTWLAAAPAVVGGGIGARDDDAEREPFEVLLEPLIDEARALGLEVPKAFVRFMSAPELMERVASCTACYLDLPNRLIPLPAAQPGRLLRFLNDQQCCLLWYLRLLPGGGHEVVSAYPAFDDAGGDSLEDVCTPEELTVCAPSFLDFIQRFWLENTLWYAVHRGRALTPEERAYADAATKAHLADE